jgi:TnpA family transposase
MTKHTPEALKDIAWRLQYSIGGRYKDEAANVLRDIANEMEATNYPEIPEGWKLVPIEPTDEMLNHFSGTNFRNLNPSKMAEEIAAYSRMLAAAPSPKGDV